MSDLMDRIAICWTPDRYSEESRKNTALLLYFTAVGVITNFIYSGYVMFIIKNDEMAMRMIAVGSFLVCPIAIHIATRSFTFSANCLVFVFFAVISSIIIMSQKYPGHIFFWFQLPVLMSGLLVGRKWAIFWGTVCILFTFGYYLRGGTFSPVSGTSADLIDLVHLWSIVGISIVSLMFVCLYAGAIERNIGDLKKKNEQNRNLLQLVAHDVINPLMIIYTTVKLIMKHDDPLTEKEKKAWEKIDRASETMKEILDQVRKMHAVESGKVQLKLEPVNVIQAVKNSRFLFIEKLEAKNIEIVYKDCDEYIYALADVVTFGNQVISNLISNAIKFSNQNGKITIRIGIEPSKLDESDESEEMVHLRISDNGIGMPEDIVKNIFDSSQQTSRPGTAGEAGTGFGMPLVKNYIDQYGGIILVDSKSIEDFPKGHGTSVDIYLKKAFGTSD